MGKSKSLRRKTLKNKLLRTKSKRRSRTEKHISNANKSHIIRIFFDMLNTVKLYHWKTKSYAQHKATDELYGRLNENIDKFVEVLLGKDESRIQMVEKHIVLMDPSKTKDFKEKIYMYRDFLTNMNKYFDEKTDTDLISIRDDILVDINQFLYLMTFH
jgi:DNA-binding ferritin-like protein